MDYSSLPITYQNTIPEEYIDVMGHMNVKWYTHMFDEAVYILWGLFGIGMEYHKNSNMGSFALEMHIRYIAEVRLGDSITIRSRALEYSPKTFHFIHFMVRDHDDILAATAELVGVHIDMQTRRSTPFSEENLLKLEHLVKEHQKLDWEAPVCGVMGVR